MPKQTLFTRSTGLNTRDDPTREAFNKDSGISNLSTAVNVSIDNTGKISRRKGTNQTVAGEFHSLWSDGGECFVIKETASYGSVMQIGSDLLTTGIRAYLTKDKRMAFLDWNGDTLYTNGFENGIISNGVSSAWPIGVYKGPPTTRQFTGAPIGNHLAEHKGRVVVAKDDVLWFSEPYAIGLYNASKMFWPFPERIVMVKSIGEGLFVSGEKTIYFLQGNSPLDFIQTKVATFPAHEWSVAHDKIELVDIGLSEVEEFGIIWSSSEGICIGLPSGKVKKLTEKQLVYPSRYTKGACLLCGYHVINTMY